MSDSKVRSGSFQDQGSDNELHIQRKFQEDNSREQHQHSLQNMGIKSKIYSATLMVQLTYNFNSMV